MNESERLRSHCGRPEARKRAYVAPEGPALLDSGQHLVHELAPGRSVWLHLVGGEVSLGDVVLTTGDGIGITAERSVSVTAREESEILLVDLGATPT